MIAGTLEIQMLAQLARLADDMHKAQGMVGGAMKNIERSVASAKAALGALGIGLSVGYFVHLVKGSIDAADRLEDLRKSTNLTIHDLAGLKLLAAQSGTDLDSLAKFINKMSVEMGKDPAKFRALGIDAKNNKEALMQFSDIFNALPDINQRNALTMAVFGKSWEQLAPVLAEGGKKIGETIDDGARLSGMTADNAAAADALNDKWDELSITMSGQVMSAVDTLWLSLNDVSDLLLTIAKDESLKTFLTGTALSITEFARVSVLGIKTLIFALHELAIVANTALKQLVAMTRLSTIGDVAQIGRDGIEELARVRDQYVKESAALMQNSFAFGNPQLPATASAAQSVDKDAAAAAARRAKAFLDADAAAKALKKSQDEIAKSEQDYMKSVGDTTQALMDKAVAAQQENELIGKTAAQIALIEAARYDEQISAKVAQAAILDGIPGREAELFLIREQIKALLILKGAREEKGILEDNAEAQKKLDEQNKRTAEALEGHITEALMRGFENGKSFSENFKDTLENMFKSMVLEPQIKATVTMALDALGFGASSTALTSSATALTSSAAALNSAAAALSASAGANTAGSAAGGAAAGGSSVAGSGISTASLGIGAGLAALWYFGFGLNKGLDIGPSRLVGKFDREGFTGNRQRSWEAEGGWFTGDRSGTYTSAITERENKAYKELVDGLQQTFNTLGDAIGYSSVRTKDWSVNINQAGDVTATLTEGIALALVPSLELFRKTGEDLVQTAQRLTSAFQSTNYFINALGIGAAEAFGTLGIAGGEARLKLIDAAGGLDIFNRNATFFIDNFLTPAQKLAPALDAVGRAFAQLGITGIATNEQFAERIELETKLGNFDVVAKLLSVSEAFNAVTQSASQMISTKSFSTMVDYMRATGRAKANAGAQIDEATKEQAALLPIEDAANEKAAKKAAAYREMMYWMDTWNFEGSGTANGQAFWEKYGHTIPLIGPPGQWMWALEQEYLKKKAIYDALPSYATGNPYVAQDMTANIHRGEMVVDAQSASMMRRYGLSSGNDALVAEIRALKAEVASLRTSSEDTARSTRKTSDLLRNVTRDGESVLTTPA